jgi:hypothetical protein
LRATPGAILSFRKLSVTTSVPSSSVSAGRSVPICAA